MTTTFLWEREDGAEVPIELEFECAPYYPAVVSGPPDRCRPAEGGDVEQVEFSSEDTEDLAEFKAAYVRSGVLQGEVDAACFEASRNYDHSRFYARSVN